MSQLGGAHPVQALQLLLRRLARRYQFLSNEIGLADAQLRGLVRTAAPGLLARLSVGVEITEQLLTTGGGNPGGALGGGVPLTCAEPHRFDQ